MEGEIKAAVRNGIPVYPVIDPDNPLCYPGHAAGVVGVMTLASK
jgi:hypothetical protein